MPDTLSLKEKGKKNSLPGEQPSLFSHAPRQVLAMILSTWLLLLFRVVLRPLNWSHGKQTGFKPVLLSSASDLPYGSQLGWTWAGSGGTASAAAGVIAVPMTNQLRVCVRESVRAGESCLKNMLFPTLVPSGNHKPCLSLFLFPGLGALVVVLSMVIEQLLRCEGSCLFWFSPPAASGREPTTSLTAFRSNQNTSTNHTVTKSFGCFRWKDLCPQRLGQPIIAHSLCLPTSYDCSFHLIFNVAVALPH